MNSENITFNGLNITTIIWTEYGFKPDSKGSIISIGDKLEEYFIQNKLIDELATQMNICEEDAMYGKPIFDRTKGNQHIKITRFLDCKFDNVVSKMFTLRFHVCNRIDNSRAKITASAEFDFRDDPKNSIQIIDIMNSVFQKQQDICRYIHNTIPESYSLGDIYYVTNIASIESNDRDIDTLIASVFSTDINNFELHYNSNRIPQKKMLETYAVLLSDKILVSPNIESITPEKIGNVMLEHNAKQSKMVLHQAKDKIPTKTMNLEIDQSHRIITNLTEQYCASEVTNRLVNDYLGMT